MAGIYIENMSRIGGNLTTNISRNLIMQLFLSGTPFSIIELASHKDFTADYNLYYGINKCLTGLNNSPFYISGYVYITPGNPTYCQTLADRQYATGFDKFFGQPHHQSQSPCCQG